MTDAERVALAVRRGSRMLGPDGSRHPTRWEFYRWTWPAEADPTHGDVEIRRACAACAETSDES